MLRKRGAVLPGISCEVLFRRNLHPLLAKKSGECLPLCLGDAAAVKGKPRILRHLCLQPFVKRRNAGLSHFHQGDAASCKLMLCLNKITSVCPERGFFSPHGENACGACKAAVVLSCLETVCHIFRVVIIRGRNDHGVHTVSLHRTAKRRKTCNASVLCHFSLSFFPVFSPTLRSFLSDSPVFSLLKFSSGLFSGNSPSENFLSEFQMPRNFSTSAAIALSSLSQTVL